MNTLGSNIADLRQKSGMTQNQLATLLGVSPQAISKWENSASYPDVMLMPTIADAFGITIDELYGRDVAKLATLPFGQVPTKNYEMAMLHMIRANLSATSADINAEVRAAKKFLAEHPQHKMALVCSRHEGTFVSPHVALTYLGDDAAPLNLLQNPGAARFLNCISKEISRKILRHQYIHRHQYCTAVAIAEACQVSEAEAEEALAELIALRLVRQDEISTGSTEQPLTVYRTCGEDRMFLIFAMLDLAADLSNYGHCYHMSWRGEPMHSDPNV